jgi:molybdopterin synthase sulfur carrier subunit
MLNVKIVFLSVLVDITEIEELILPLDDESNMRNILEQLSLKFGKKFEEMIFKDSEELSKYVIITINGKDIRTIDGLNTKVEVNDEISFIPAIAGG